MIDIASKISGWLSRNESTRTNKHRRRFSPRIEQLEERAMMAADITAEWNFDQNAYQLNVTGTDDADTIVVGYDDGDLLARVLDANDNVLVSKSYGGLPFWRIHILGLGGDDVIYSTTGIQDDIQGGVGDDTIWSEGADSFLAGGAGNDEIHALGTVDVNVVLGGDGHDVLYGSFGSDYFGGGDGNDHLEGGEGGDVLFGNNGNDFLDGGYDNDYDVLWGGEGNDFLVQHWKRFIYGPGVNQWFWITEDAYFDYDDADDTPIYVYHWW